MFATKASTLLLLIPTVLGATGCSVLASALRGSNNEAKEEEEAKRKQEEDQKEAAKVTEYRSTIAAASCDDVFRIYRERSTPETYGAETAKDTRVALTKKFIACKKNAELFSCLGNIVGGRYFHAAKEEGVDVIGALKDYLASPERKGLFQLDSCKNDDGYSRRAVYEWLRNEDEDLCSNFIAAMETADPETRAGIVAGYLTPKKCAGAAKLAVTGLQADPAWAKEETCAYLGAHGDTSYIQDIETVANAYSEVVYRDGRAFVPVRDVCMQAAAKLKLKKSEPAPEAPTKKDPAPTKKDPAPKK
ncbi:MAG: hypothetical protein HOW73_15700 [Polyangiaceae bacterium]|nr:hypothetical protein [Polyangiaceae bacterium]